MVCLYHTWNIWYIYGILTIHGIYVVYLPIHGIVDFYGK